MALSTPFSSLRRTLAQRLQYWGGDIQDNGPSAFTSTGTSNTAVDSSRAEPDDEWDDAWIVLNPGSSDQVNAPTIWRRIAPEGGFIGNTGVLTIIGTWPSPYNLIGPGFASGTSTAVNASTLTDATATWVINQWKGHTISMGNSSGFILSNTGTVLTLTSAGWAGGTPSLDGYTITLPYELYKTFRPETWLQAINWAISRAYPKRHVAASFEVPQDYRERIIPWGQLVKNLALLNPTVAPIVTEISNGMGQYIPGTYTFAYSLYNNLGETLNSPTATLVITGTNSMVQFGAITGVPAAAKGAKYFSSLQPNDSQLGQLSTGQGAQPSSVTSGSLLGENLNGIIDAIQFPSPYSGETAFPPIYNTTNVDVQELHHILKRVNPGGYPEIWDDLGAEWYKPLGGKTIMLMFYPIGFYSLKFICTAVIPSITKETDVTDEPPEMLYSGGESYLWDLLNKTSTIVNVNWEKLAKDANTKYEELKDEYGMDQPRTVIYRPVIRTQY